MNDILRGWCCPGLCVTFIFVLLFCMSDVYPYWNISLNMGTLCLYHSLTIVLLKLSRIKPAFCFIVRCTGYDVMLLKFVWLATGQWFPPGTLVSSTNKTGSHDVAEILLKVTLNTTTLALTPLSYFNRYATRDAMKSLKIRWREQESLWTDLNITSLMTPLWTGTG
jgi:hypothetical protein